MNRLQGSKNKRDLALRDFLNQNAGITTPLPGFGNLFTVFSGNLDRIGLLREQQETDKTGIARHKRELRDDLVTKAIEISRKTASYAQMSNNTELVSQVCYTQSHLKTANDNLLIDRARLIHDKAQENLEALSPYDVSADDLAALKIVLDSFIAVLPKPRMGINEKKQVTHQLALLIKDNELLLKKMDALIQIVRGKQPAFYAAYMNHRRVIETGNSPLVLRALVTDASTHTGIRGVKVTFAPLNGTALLSTEKTNKLMVKTTAAKGMFRVKNMPAGNYMVTVSKAGYRVQTLPVTIIDYVLADMKVELERA